MILFATGGRFPAAFRARGLESALDLGPEQVRAPDAEVPPDRLEAEGAARTEEGGDLVLGEVVRQNARGPQARTVLDLSARAGPEVLAREDAEMEAAPGGGHAHGLGGHRMPLVRAPVAQDVEEEDRVERTVPEGQAPGVAADEEGRGAPRGRAAEGERRRRQVQAYDGAGPGRECRERTAVAAAELEHGGAFRDGRKADAPAVEPAALPVVVIPARVVHLSRSSPSAVCISML